MMQVPLFVYGTLRPEHRLHDMLERDVITHKPAELHGARLFVPEGYWFPIAVPTDNATDVVHGDLLLCRDGEALREVVKMELSAGYRMRNNYIFVEDKMVRATMFMYQRAPENSTQIISGDWSDWERMETTLDM
jgi:gamma-glutamylcyclotransferase (GGCT)/AIG2-like uncharacterized protein YtfP